MPVRIAHSSRASASKISWTNRRYRSILAALGTVLFLSSSLPAQADLKLCNTTSSRIGVVIGYKDDKGWTTEGWWNIPSNACWTLIKGELVARYYYVHAIDYDRPGVWDRNESEASNKAEFFMCTEDKSFVIRGAGQCEERGFNRTRFFEVDTQDEDSWTITLQDKVEKRVAN